MPAIDSFLATLFVLRTGATKELTSRLFDVSPQTLGAEFDMWIRALVCMKRKRFPPPTTEQTRATTPASYIRDYGKGIAWFLDATELQMETSSDPWVAGTYWSDYKQRRTIKLLGALHISGGLLYMSEAYPGKISDHDITAVSGFLDWLHPGDHVCADKGFLIYYLLAKHGCRLWVPPKARKNQEAFLGDQCADTSRIARTRIHVERAFRHMKTFRMLHHPIKILELDMMSSVFEACAFLTTLRPPLIAREE